MPPRVARKACCDARQIRSHAFPSFLYRYRAMSSRLFARSAHAQHAQNTLRRPHGQNRLDPRPRNSDPSCLETTRSRRPQHASRGLTPARGPCDPIAGAQGAGNHAASITKRLEKSDDSRMDKRYSPRGERAGIKLQIIVKDNRFPVDEHVPTATGRIPVMRGRETSDNSRSGLGSGLVYRPAFGWFIDLRYRRCARFKASALLWRGLRSATIARRQVMHGRPANLEK